MKKIPDPFVILVFIMVWMLLLDAHSAMAQQSETEGVEPAPPTKTSDSRSELDELGVTLKAAVLSGSLSEVDALNIYQNMANRLAPEKGKKNIEKGNAGDGPYATKMNLMKLAAPRPGQMAVLFQPEFLTRDVVFLRRELGLGRDQMGIIEILIHDYLEAFELALSPLREGLRQCHRLTFEKECIATLNRIKVIEADVAKQNTIESLKKLDHEAITKITDRVGSEEASDIAAIIISSRRELSQRMIEVTSTMQDRLADLKEQVQSSLTTLQRADTPLNIADLIAIAKEFRAERTLLRKDFTESLRIIAFLDLDESEQQRFNIAIARLRIEHDLGRGRLGGESMNLWGAFTEAGQLDEINRDRRSQYNAIQITLNQQTPALAATIHTRTEATIEREIRGLELLAFQATDSAPLTTTQERFAHAGRQEVAASVAVRDELLAWLEHLYALLDEAYPDTTVPQVFREAALGRGFRTEMRRRWAERAIDAALKLDDLTEELQIALALSESEIEVELRALRNSAIAKRIQRDPKRAYGLIEKQFEPGNDRWGKLSFKDAFGINYPAYQAIDDRVEAQLRAILTTEQFSQLPSRPKLFFDEKKRSPDKKNM